MISNSTIDKIFSTARIEEVIGEFVSLKKSGSNYKGLSPFTEEKTPSFLSLLQNKFSNALAQELVEMLSNS